MGAEPTVEFWNLIANGVATLGILVLLSWVSSFSRRFGELETTIKMGFAENERSHVATNARIQSIEDDLRKLELQVAAITAHVATIQRQGVPKQ